MFEIGEARASPVRTCPRPFLFDGDVVPRTTSSLDFTPDARKNSPVANSRRHRIRLFSAIQLHLHPHQEPSQDPYETANELSPAIGTMSRGLLRRLGPTPCSPRISRPMTNVDTTLR